MRNFSLYALPLFLAAVALPAKWVLGAEDQAAVRSAESPWPMRFSASAGEFVVYPPHVDKSGDGVLRGRAAVSVQGQGAERPSFGTLWIRARARRDAATRTVYVSDVEVEKAEFPAAPERSGDYLAVLRERLASKSWQVAEQRLDSDMSIDRAAQRARNQPLRNDPPQIIFSERPAILVPIDGAPVLRDVEGTNLLRVVNTRALLLLDKAGGRYYLRVAGHWMSAGSLDGPWSEGGVTPGEIDQARQIAERQGEVDLLEDEEEVATAAAPAIHVATTPTELLQTEGPPEFSPIEGTQLLYVTNSANGIFLDLRSQRYFVLISGRWYRGVDLAGGRWEYVPGGQLPADFAMIPADHPMAAVRASVPGSPQAREAVIASDAPQVATIRRDTARIELTYDGEPQFRPIEGTSLHYAVNAPIPVIRVSADSYYALDNGVWFTARSPYGTWSVASYVPAAIYGIPASSPLHYVTYVRIYHDTPETVDVGYTAGYVGSYVSPDSVVVYGSGWYYPSWVGYYWFAPPYTWGYGFSFFYSWWYPWGPPLYVAWRPYPCYRPWWGPWTVAHHGWVGGALAHVPGHRPPHVAKIYDRWGPKVVTRGPVSTRHFERGAAARPLRPGEGYIIKDGRRFDIAAADDDRRERPAWRDGDRSGLPQIQGRQPREDRGSAGRPEARFAPEHRSLADANRRQEIARGRSRWQEGKPEARTGAMPLGAREAPPAIQGRAQTPRPTQLRDRGDRRPAPTVGREWPTRDIPGRAAGMESQRRRQLALPQREAIEAPGERRMWTRPQGAREMQLPRMQPEAREMPRMQRESPRLEGWRDWRRGG